MRLLQPTLFFPKTVAARGFRDAWHGCPRETDFVQTVAQGEPAGAVVRDSATIYSGNSGSRADEPGAREAVRLAPYEQILINHTETRIDSLEARLGKAKASAVSKTLKYRYRLHHLLTGCQKTFDDYRDKGFRKPDRMVPHWLYVPIMIVLGVSEFVFNLTAFEWLKFGDIETLCVALGLGVATPIVAHCFGCAARQSRKDWRTILMITLMAAFFLPGVWSVAWLRQQFLLEQAALLGIPLSTTADWAHLALLSVNLFIFIFSVGLAFFAHDPDRDLERLHREKERRWKAANRQWKQWSGEAVRFNKMVAVAAAEADRLRDECLTAIAEYRDHNLRSRKDSGPSWFRTAVTRSVFCQRDLGALLERQPDPLNEILEPAEASTPPLWSAAELVRPNGANGAGAPRQTTEGENREEA